MTDYSAKSRGLWVNGDTLVGSLTGYDFLIAKHGEKFHLNVQKAYDAKIPCILFYENDPTVIINNGMDESHWTNDPNLNSIVTDIGARAVHGFIVDCSKHIEANGNLLAVQWLTRPGQNLITQGFKKTGKPAFLYMGVTVPDAYKGLDKDTIYNFIVANEGICTFSAATSFSGVYPTSDPKLPYYDSVKAPWFFWLYKSVAGGIDVLFNGDKEKLHKTLGYKSSGTVTPPPVVVVPPVVVTPPPVVVVPPVEEEDDFVASVDLVNAIDRMTREIKRRNDWEIYRQA